MPHPSSGRAVPIPRLRNNRLKPTATTAIQTRLSTEANVSVVIRPGNVPSGDL